MLTLIKNKETNKYQGSYIDESNLGAPWKLFTRILKEVLRFCYIGSTDFIFYFYMLFRTWELFILFDLDLNNWPEVRHIVYLKFYSVYLIYILCFWTISFWIFFSLMYIFSESICLFFTWSFLSFYNLFKWAIRAASWCFCNVYFLFFILSFIYKFFYYLYFYYNFSAYVLSFYAYKYCFCFTNSFYLVFRSITLLEGFR